MLIKSIKTCAVCAHQPMTSREKKKQTFQTEKMFATLISGFHSILFAYKNASREHIPVQGSLVIFTFWIYARSNENIDADVTDGVVVFFTFEQFSNEIDRIDRKDPEEEERWYDKQTKISLLKTQRKRTSREWSEKQNCGTVDQTSRWLNANEWGGGRCNRQKEKHGWCSSWNYSEPLCAISYRPMHHVTIIMWKLICRNGNSLDVFIVAASTVAGVSLFVLMLLSCDAHAV